MERGRKRDVWNATDLDPTFRASFITGVFRRPAFELCDIVRSDMKSVRRLRYRLVLAWYLPL